MIEIVINNRECVGSFPISQQKEKNVCTSHTNIEFGQRGVILSICMKRWYDLQLERVQARGIETCVTWSSAYMWHDLWRRDAQEVVKQWHDARRWSVGEELFFVSRRAERHKPVCWLWSSNSNYSGWCNHCCEVMKCNSQSGDLRGGTPSALKYPWCEVSNMRTNAENNVHNYTQKWGPNRTLTSVYLNTVHLLCGALI